MSIELYQARMAALIEAAGIVSGVGDPPDNIATPFTFVWGPVPVEASHTAAGCDQQVDLEFHVQVVDDQPAKVLLLAGRVKDAIRDKELDIAGWRCFPLKITGSEPVQTARGAIDPDTNQYPAWCTLHVRLQATKE